MSKYKLQLFYFPGCPFCDLVISAIEKLKISSIELSNTKQNPEFQNLLMKDTGRKTVPCLYINGKPMHESRDIIKWLEQNRSEIA